MKALIILVLLLPMVANADSFVVHMACYHTTDRANLKEMDARNETNPGLGYVKKHFAVGFFKNSESGMSTYWTARNSYKNLSVTYGVVTGYRESPVLPFASLNAKVSFAMFSLIPGYDVTNHTVVPVIAFSETF